MFLNKFDLFFSWKLYQILRLWLLINLFSSNFSFANVASGQSLLNHFHRTLLRCAPLGVTACKFVYLLVVGVKNKCSFSFCRILSRCGSYSPVNLKIINLYFDDRLDLVDLRHLFFYLIVPHYHSNLHWSPLNTEGGSMLMSEGCAICWGNQEVL